MNDTTTSTESTRTAEGTAIKAKTLCRLRIILVRHGESENNLHHEVSLEAFEANRVPDPSMTPRGKKQAQHVADYFQQRGKNENAVLNNIDIMYVSPMLRALQTAAPLAKALDLRPKVWTDIYEISGIFHQTTGQGGITRSELQKQFPNYDLSTATSLTESGWYDVRLGRESHQHGKERVQRVWEDLKRMAEELVEKDRSILMVVHGDFIDHLMQAALGILDFTNNSSNGGDPLVEKHKIFPTWNASITTLDLCPAKSLRPTILFHNSVSHLPSDMVKTDKLGKC